MGEKVRSKDFSPGYLSTEVLTTNSSKLMGQTSSVQSLKFKKPLDDAIDEMSLWYQLKTINYCQLVCP
ncbi:hypothetical protein NSTCB13_07400 [Nostoc sp. DSM 114160]|jgi:hypothetical protein